MHFKELNLDPKLLKAVEACGFEQATEIQQQAIPLVLEGRDLMASAQTGTGKTAAFVLPALQRLLTPSVTDGRGPRVLVLTPTRELAMQVNQNIEQLSRFSRFVTGTVVGGMPYPPQMRMLKNRLDLLVATPGRLMDHMESGRVDFSRIEMLVLDEADRMLDMGFINAVNTIGKAIKTQHQTLLFSATLEGKVADVAKKLLKNPERIQLAVNHEQHESIEQRLHRADDIGHKHRLLHHYLDHPDMTQAVIFTATKRGADRLARTLSEKGHQAAALHGDMSQGARKRTVTHMHHGRTRLLVATDVAARGLDIKGISHVINFDLPMVAEDYIHRIGRTGRGGATGTAVSFVGPDDRAKLRDIMRLTRNQISHQDIPGLEPVTPEPRGHNSEKRKGKGSYKGRQGKPGFKGAGKGRNGARGRPAAGFRGQRDHDGGQADGEPRRGRGGRSGQHAGEANGNVARNTHTNSRNKPGHNTSGKPAHHKGRPGSKGKRPHYRSQMNAVIG